MAEEPDPLAAFERAALKRRAWMGVAALAIGFAMVLFGVWCFVGTFHGRFGRTGLIRFGAASAVIGALIVAAGWRQLVGHGTDPDTGQPIVQTPVPIKMAVVYGILCALAIVALAGIPLGFYKSAGDAGKCGRLLTEAELSELAGRTVTTRLQGDDEKCYMTADIATVPAANVTLGFDMGGSQWKNEIEFATRNGDYKQTKLDFADNAAIYRGKLQTIIGFTRGHAGALVELANDMFTDEAIAKALDKIKTRVDLLDSFDHAWKSKYPGRD